MLLKSLDLDLSIETFSFLSQSPQQFDVDRKGLLFATCRQVTYESSLDFFHNASHLYLACTASEQ